MIEASLCVIGAGMFGSAAAKYALVMGEASVCVVGPSDNETHTARGAHFDMSRITRRLDTTSGVNSHTNDLSIRRYRTLEHDSGIAFYENCGFVWLGTAATKDRVDCCLESMEGGTQRAWYHSHHAEGAAHFAAQLKKRTGLNIETALASSDVTVLEELPDEDGNCGGTVHPNRLVEAQLSLAAKATALRFQHVKEAAVQVLCADSEFPLFRVVTHTGRVVFAKKVLLAAGAMTSLHELIPNSLLRGRKLLIEVVTETVTLLRLKDTLGERSWSGCPAIISTHHHDPLNHYYCLPPRQYDDGHWYVKMGPSGTLFAKDVTSVADACDWVDGHGDCSEERSKLVELLMEVYGDVIDHTVAPRTLHCVFDRTPQRLPYIGHLGNGFYVCVGGNGTSAKNSDEIGRLAANLVCGGSAVLSNYQQLLEPLFQ